jgi:hypothetical protein
MSNEINMENVVVLFKTFEDLKRDEDLILKECSAQWDDAFSAFEVARDSVLAGDGAALAKVVDTASSFAALKKSGRYAALKKLDPSLCAKIDKISSEFAIVAAEHHRLKTEITAKLEVIQTLHNARAAAIEKRNDRLYGNTALARRSLRFAMASDRRYYGPAATVTTIGAKQ